MQVRALASGNVNVPPQGAPEKAAQQSTGLFDGSVDRIAWPAWLRKLDRVDSSFRE